MLEAVDDNLLVILNDNNMSISHAVGGLSSYFARMWASKPYNFIRKGGKQLLSKIPPALKAAHRAEEYMKGMVSSRHPVRRNRLQLYRPDRWS